jgi:hypothetical protein
MTTAGGDWTLQMVFEMANAIPEISRFSRRVVRAGVRLVRRFDSIQPTSHRSAPIVLGRDTTRSDRSKTRNLAYMHNSFLPPCTNTLIAGHLTLLSRAS